MKSIIDDLRRENNELRGEDVKKTEQLAVLEKKLKISEVELEKANNKIEAWKTECKDHDDWVSKVYKSMSVDGRAEFRNAFTVAAQDTDAIRNSLGQLSSLTGALKIHEIFIGEDLVVKKKMLPNDPFYKAVLIKESRKKSTVTNVLDDYNSE